MHSSARDLVMELIHELDQYSLDELKELKPLWLEGIKSENHKLGIMNQEAAIGFVTALCDVIIRLNEHGCHPKADKVLSPYITMDKYGCDMDVAELILNEDEENSHVSED